jgi:hypothetical protein
MLKLGDLGVEGLDSVLSDLELLGQLQGLTPEPVTLFLYLACSQLRRGFRFDQLLVLV